MRNISHWTLFGILILLALTALPNLRAQVTGGAILGTVRDSSGAVMPNVSISVKSVETGAVRNVTTNSSGAYEALSLPAGAYDIQASIRGFTTQERHAITLTVGAAVTVNFTLAVGAVESKVVVTGQAPQVETTTATVSGVVGDTKIRQLPLNGRDWLQLATLQVGVVGGLGQASSQDPTSSRAARGNGENLYISGNRPTENVFLVDGLIVNDYSNASPGSGLGVNLGVDAVREFSVLTSEYTAKYGMTSGGVVNAIFKSGSNKFHGDGFGFFRNSALDARNFFDGPNIPPFRRYQYGASLGGPIQKDKTFFFGSFEGLNQNLSLSESSPTLSPNASRGILQCVPGVPACAGGAATYTVPIAPAIVPFLKIFPVANGAISGDEGLYNFPGAETGHEYYTVGRIDHNFSAQTTLSGSFQWDTGALQEPDPYNQKLFGAPSQHTNGILTLQHIFSPTLLNTARIGVSRTYAGDSIDISALNPVATDTSLGFLPNSPVGQITVGNLATDGGLGASGSDIFHFTSYQASDDASWVRGRHTLQFGALFDRIDDNTVGLAAPLGEWDFGSVVDFLTNTPEDFFSQFPGTSGDFGLRSTYLGAYIQDQFRVRSNVTVNVGLRYEFATPVSAAHGRTATLPTLTSPTIRTGGSYFQNPTLRNFAPRVGIAWDPTGSGKTSIRAGYGIYDILPLPYVLYNRSHSAPFYLQGQVTSPPASAFPSNGFGLLTPTSVRVSYIQPNPKRAYNQQWNLTIQRQITSNTMIMIGYVGSHAVHVPYENVDTNVVPPSLTSIAPDGNIRFPIPPGGDPANAQRINPNFGQILETRWNGNSNYNGLLVSAEKKFGRGFDVQANYTWSKGIDLGSNTFSDGEYINTVGSPYPFFPKLQRGPSDYDITHNFIMNGLWNIPVPGSFNRGERAILGGWQLGGIFNAHSGMPFSVQLNSDPAFTGVGHQGLAERPNFNPLPGCSVNAINPGQPSNYIKFQCFSFPAPGELGNLGRNTLRGPGFADFDFSLFKNIGFAGEKYKVQFRAEAFNVLNRTNFSVQSPTIFNKQGIIDPTTGQLLPPTLTTSRQIQLGVKFEW